MNQCYGEIYDKTIRERLRHLDVPHRFKVPPSGKPDFTEAEQERFEQRIVRTVQLFDYRQQMLDHRKLGMGGGISERTSLVNDPKTVLMRRIYNSFLQRRRIYLCALDNRARLRQRHRDREAEGAQGGEEGCEANGRWWRRDEV